MAKDAKNTPTPLSVMLGAGEEFEAKGKIYTVMPIVAAHIEQFQKDNIFIGENQLFNFFDEKSKKVMNKWLGGEKVTTKMLDKEISTIYCYDENDEPMNLEKAMADGWDVVDFKRYFRKLCDVSG